MLQRYSTLKLGVVAALMIAVAVVGLRRAPHRTPRNVRITTASGRSLGSFYDGLKPDARIRDRIEALPKARACGPKSPGILARIGRIFGVVATVHAVSGCNSMPCTSCYVQTVEGQCSGQCPGKYVGGYMEGPEDIGLQEFPRLSCGANPDYCPCYVTWCYNGDNCGL